MTIQFRLLFALAASSLVLLFGISTSCAAQAAFGEPESAEQSLTSPDQGVPERGDPVPERSLDEPGSRAEVDPRVEPLAESSRLESVIAQPTRPPYPVVLNPQVEFFLNRFTRDRREIVGLWLTRATRYLGMIREVLRSRGLPEELAFTAMIESGFNPVAVSRMGAAGLWQFMATTARRYGLRVDHWVDERMDAEKSTVAAASYFRDLYQQFGSWMLAQAAYNAGEVKVSKAIRATGSKDFWELARSRWLLRETKEFVPQIQAVTVIGRDPNRYGFDTSEIRSLVAEDVSVPAATDLRRLSMSSGVAFEALRELNPTLVRGVTPPSGSFTLRIPPGTRTGVLAALSSARSTSIARASGATTRASGHASVHVVRPRDTVTSIAQRYGVSVGDVLRWNSLERRDPIRPGDHLRVAERRLSSDRERQAGAR